MLFLKQVSELKAGLATLLQGFVFIVALIRAQKIEVIDR